MVVAPARYPPQSNIRSFAVGKDAGAMAGMGAGIAATRLFAAAGPLNAVIAPYIAAIVIPVTTISGGVTGSHAAISEQDSAALEAHINDHLATLQIASTFAQTIVDMASQDAARELPLLEDAGPASPEAKPDFRTLALRDADSLMVVDATGIGFTGDDRLRFYLKATIRIIRISDGNLMYQRELVYQSDDYDAIEWGQQEAALFQEELERSYTSLANSVVEQVFLLTPLPLESRAKGDNESRGFDPLGARFLACGLAWISPQHDFSPKFIGDIEHHDWNRFPKVPGLQPTLAWEAFPGDEDRSASIGVDIAGIQDVRYDLRVWEVMDNGPPRLVYQRNRLPSPSHTLEQSLKPETRYYWSARARFNLNGHVRGTKWGYFRVPNYEIGGINNPVKPTPSPAAVLGPLLAGSSPRDACTLDFIPVANYYRFETP